MTTINICKRFGRKIGKRTAYSNIQKFKPSLGIPYRKCGVVLLRYKESGCLIGDNQGAE